MRGPTPFLLPAPDAVNPQWPPGQGDPGFVRRHRVLIII